MNTHYENFDGWLTDIIQPITNPSITVRCTISPTYEYLQPKPTLVKLVNNNPYTIAFWSDNTQTRATCLPEDNYSPQKGLFICRMKKKYGSWTAYQEAKKNKQADKEVRKLLRKIARKIELENALVINVNK